MSRSEKEVPKSLKECCETDYVSGNIRSWADWIESWGEKIFIILIIIGIVSTIASAMQTAIIAEDLVFPSIITSIITWVLYVFLEYCTYHILAVIIAALVAIVQNTEIAANAALYNATKGRYLTGDNPKTTSPETTQNSNHFWICKECGTKNDGGNICCKDCGVYK